MKHWILLVIAMLSMILTGCHKKEGPNEVRVGVIAGPESELMETARQVAAKNYNLNIEIVEFSDYTMPNEALASGDIDANAFQTIPYLEAAIQQKGYQFTAIGKTFIYPMAIYSHRIKSLSQLRNGAIVAIQNDPIDQGRALLLLQQANLIRLKSTANSAPTLNDIISNPKHLRFHEVDAAQVPRLLPDVDIATINTNYAMLANLSPKKNGLFVEDTASPYANIIVVRTAQKDDPRFQKLINAFQSRAVIAKAQELFHGEAIPTWQQNQ